MSWNTIWRATKLSSSNKCMGSTSLLAWLIAVLCLTVLVQLRSDAAESAQSKFKKAILTIDRTIAANKKRGENYTSREGREKLESYFYGPKLLKQFSEIQLSQKEMDALFKTVHMEAKTQECKHQLNNHVFPVLGSDYLDY